MLIILVFFLLVFVASYLEIWWWCLKTAEFFFFFRSDLVLSKMLDAFHPNQGVVSDRRTYRSRVYFRVGSVYRKQRCMFSECEFHTNSSVNWKQLGDVSQVRFNSNCANLYIRYRILASGFFQLNIKKGQPMVPSSRMSYSDSHFYGVLFSIWNKNKKSLESSNSKKTTRHFFEELKRFQVGWEFKLLFWLNKICFFLPHKCAFGDWIKRIKLMFWILEFKTISWFLLWFYPYYFYSPFSKMKCGQSNVDWLPKKLKNETR